MGNDMQKSFIWILCILYTLSQRFAFVKYAFHSLSRPPQIVCRLAATAAAFVTELGNGFLWRHQAIQASWSVDASADSGTFPVPLPNFACHLFIYSWTISVDFKHPQGVSNRRQRPLRRSLIPLLWWNVRIPYTRSGFHSENLSLFDHFPICIECVCPYHWLFCMLLICRFDVNLFAYNLVIISHRQQRWRQGSKTHIW